MRDSPLASKLKAIGFHPASMQQEAEELSALQTRVVSARNAAVQATSELRARAGEFATKYASYCNLVRGLTMDPGLRRKHGVKSPGLRKGPLFHRAPRANASVATPTASMPSTNGASSSKGAGTDAVVTSVGGS